VQSQQSGSEKRLTKTKNYKDLAKTIEDGFPENKQNLPETLKIFWKLKDELYTVEGLIYADGKVLIPLNLN